jgi:division/cell wall cluster transcriptional repressor MraZ
VLYVFSTKEFERVYEKIREAPLTNKQARDFQRMFLSGASDEKPDSQSRITIPPHLRTYANLDRELVVTGVGATPRSGMRGVERLRRQQRRQLLRHGAGGDPGPF